jgi:hypothetical protein
MTGALSLAGPDPDPDGCIILPLENISFQAHFFSNPSDSFPPFAIYGRLLNLPFWLDRLLKLKYRS